MLAALFVLAADRCAEARRRARDRGRRPCCALRAAGPRGDAARRRCSPPRSRAPALLPPTWIAPASVRVQGALADAARSTARGSSPSAPAPLGPGHGRGKRERAVPARTGPEPRTRRWNPRRSSRLFTDGEGLSRDDPLRRPARAARLPRPAHVGPAVPPARTAAGAGARRRRREPTCCRRSSTGRAASMRWSSMRQVVDLVERAASRTTPARPTARPACALHVGEARGFVAAQPRAIRPDTGRAAGCLRRVVGRALRALGELPVHGRGAAGLPGAARPRAACWRSRAGSVCRRATSSSSSPPRSTRCERTAPRSRRASSR